MKRGPIARLLLRWFVCSLGLWVAAGILGVAFIGNEIYEQIKNGSVECNEKYFIFRTIDRKMLIWAGSKQNILSPEDASLALGKDVKSCTKESAAELAVPGPLVVLT